MYDMRWFIIEKLNWNLKTKFYHGGISSSDAMRNEHDGDTKPKEWKMQSKKDSRKEKL